MITDPERPIPSTASQRKRWAKTITERLASWVGGEALVFLRSRLAAEGLRATATVRPEKLDVIHIQYECASEGTGYVRPEVVLEFGAKSTGEPCEEHIVRCDAAAHVPSISFPTATPRVMRVERTFWEKATAIHVICAGGKIRGGGERYSRHWYDLVQLDRSGHVESALRDRDLAQHVAEHKSWFFEEKNSEGAVIDYEKAVQGGLCLKPEGEILLALKEDYEKMVGDGLLDDEAQPFDELLECCRQIQERANATVR